MNDINVFRANAFRVDRHFIDAAFRSALIAASLWARHTDPYAVAAKEYWLSIAIGWSSR